MDNIIQLEQKPDTKNPRNAGRTPKKIDWNLLAKYSEAHCNKAELRQIAGVKYATLEAAAKRDHGISLTEWMDKNKCTGKAQLKKVRYDLAVKSRAWRSIEWLSRNWLAETSTTNIEISEKKDRVVTFKMPENAREIDMRESKVLEHKDTE